MTSVTSLVNAPKPSSTILGPKAISSMVLGPKSMSTLSSNMLRPKTYEEQGILFDTRVLIGNWYERRQLAEFQNRYGFKTVRHLERYRTMVKNVNTPTELNICLDRLHFGAKVMLVSPYIPSDPCPSVKTKGMALGSRVTPNYLPYGQDFRPKFRIIGYKELEPSKKTAFIIINPDPCRYKSKVLKYNQPFSLVLAATTEEGKTPLYVRYVVNPMPGVTDPYPLELCDYPDCATQWRILPVRRPDITRFEQEGEIVPPNEDVVINHCATNINLGMQLGLWIRDYYGHVSVPVMKTCVDVHRRELPHNLWQIRTELPRTTAGKVIKKGLTRSPPQN